MLSAPITRPSPSHGPMSLVSFVFSVIVWPQVRVTAGRAAAGEATTEIATNKSATGTLRRFISKSPQLDRDEPGASSRGTQPRLARIVSPEHLSDLVRPFLG